MKALKILPAPASSTFDRDTICFLINSALESEMFRFSRQVAEEWLSAFPGDLEIRYLLAKTYHKQHNQDQALKELRNICSIDPEFLEAQQYLHEILRDMGGNERELVWSIIKALGGSTIEPCGVLDKGNSARQARAALKNNFNNNAREFVSPERKINPGSPLPDLAKLMNAIQTCKVDIQRSLAEEYAAKWPECIVFQYLLADIFIREGEEVHSLKILQNCVSKDTFGQVPKRLWGERHPYRLLWPDKMEIKLDIPIPAAIATRIGWNRLTPGAVSRDSELKGRKRENTALSDIHSEIVLEKQIGFDEFKPGIQSPISTHYDEIDKQKKIFSDNPLSNETIWPVDEAFLKLSKDIKRPELSRMDGRFPTYIVFSSKTRLIEQYGEEKARSVIDEMSKVAVAIQQRPGWGAMVFLPDDERSAEAIGIKVKRNVDPWQLKLSIHALDEALAVKGAMIGALLIVGGPNVVPFHHLPNPTEDTDKEVPSDNPYATMDTNYFIPEWPVGRLPGESGNDAGLLINQLRNISNYHKEAMQVLPWWQNIWRIFRVRHDNKGGERISNKNRSVGYTAAAWRRSSLAVFRPIGKGESVRVSPPDQSGKFDARLFNTSPVGYYNLHGLPDTPEWYGQKDISDRSNSPEYPVAIQVKDLNKNGKAPQIIFSEACYGGHIFNKSLDQSMALKFLSIGTRSIIASSCISYGSVSSPLIGADLLGYLFWKFIRDGLLVGEAFTRAKIETTREMTRRQGFLDGEDQKTLISFNLYGDPLLSYKDTSSKQPTISRMREHTEIKTVDYEVEKVEEQSYITKDIIREAKNAVRHYLPGIENAKIVIGKEQFSKVNDRENQETKNLGRLTSAKSATPGRTVVTFSKEIPSGNRIHLQFARATVNVEGKVIKISMSR